MLLPLVCRVLTPNLMVFLMVFVHPIGVMVVAVRETSAPGIIPELLKAVLATGLPLLARVMKLAAQNTPRLANVPKEGTSVRSSIVMLVPSLCRVLALRVVNVTTPIRLDLLPNMVRGGLPLLPVLGRLHPHLAGLLLPVDDHRKVGALLIEARPLDAPRQRAAAANPHIAGALLLVVEPRVVLVGLGLALVPLATVLAALGRHGILAAQVAPKVGVARAGGVVPGAGVLAPLGAAPHDTAHPKETTEPFVFVLPLLLTNVSERFLST